MCKHTEKKALRSSYPESIAKSCNGNNDPKIAALSIDETGIESYKSAAGLDRYLKKRQPLEPGDKKYRCSAGFITGSTSTKYFFKMVTCGRDWCPDCGKFGSITHCRRIVKNKMRAEQILESNKLQYLVITIPAQIRYIFNSKNSLNDFRTYWRRKLKREGYNKGIMRFHWAGEDGYIYAPHLNILVPGGFIQKKILAKWRAELAVWFRTYCKTANLPKANIYSAYTINPDKAKHWVNYIFRATQTTYNKWSAETIKGYRNTSIFGKWEKIKADPEAEALKGIYINQETGEIEKITWQMQYSDKRKCLVPKLSKLEEISLESCSLISRAFWIRDRILKPPPEKVNKISSIMGHDFYNFTE